MLAVGAHGPLGAPDFRMVGAYALAAAGAADVCHDAMYVIGNDGQPSDLIFARFTPRWTNGPTAAQVQALASAMAEQIGVDVEWT
jgi:hypothetical protein